ncbi:hypothetical protein [Virgibacillus siamensis]|uniref:hypothetical protein n=1 Tax=Virgibacillus siamensis TaxID=480071 RepID=UPI0009868FFF|nr:hypothetical protein [Virgibacillus siamensis]
MTLNDIKWLAMQNQKAYDNYGVLSTYHNVFKEIYQVHMTNDSFIESAGGHYVTVEGQRFRFMHDGTEYFTLADDDTYEEFMERFFPDVDDESFIVEYQSNEQKLQAVGMSEKEFVEG